MKKFEIWAKFPDGLEVKVEAHKSSEAAQAAVDAMDAHNRNDLATGGGFPHGVPEYEIRDAGRNASKWYVEYKAYGKRGYIGKIEAASGNEAIAQVKEKVIGATCFKVWHDDE